jgi:hypothetical protein
MEANKTILQMKYARIVDIFARESGMTLEDALGFFYDSDTYRLISEGIADMHCRSDEYLADELMLELEEANENPIRKG